MAIKRPCEGSWTPSPHMSPRSNDFSTEWASPVPRGQMSPLALPTRNVHEEVLEFDLDERDAEMDDSVAQLDCDGPRRRRSALLQGKSHQSKFIAEQLLASPGSLPKPMSKEARRSAISSLLPSATHQMLAEIPQELLMSTSRDAQALRRRLSRGATVVFVSAGLPGKRMIYERAAQLGVKAVIFDHHDSWSRCLVKEGIVAKFVPVDMTQSSEEVFKQCLTLIRSLGDDGQTGRVDAITSFIELSMPLVARLCAALGLPGMEPAAVDMARDKHATRAGMKAAGLPTPRNALIRNEAELDAAGQLVGFPAVLKPVTGAASLGVMKVTSFEELHRCYSEVSEELSSLVLSSGALVKGSAGGGGISAASATNGAIMTVLLEQYLDGPEVDIDVVVSEGEWRYAAVSDNGPTLEPYFNETWAVSPSLLPLEQQRSLKDLAVKSVEALGFSSGVFHVECKATSTGPQLIEVNARMGGGQVRECNLLTWGVDLVEETIFLALGIPARPVVPSTPLEAVAYCYVNAKHSGVVSDVSCIERLLNQEGVVWAKALCRPGDAVVGPADGLPSWICDLLVTNKSPKEALAFLHSLEASLPAGMIS